jgi:hypothetical protein
VHCDLIDCRSNPDTQSNHPAVWKWVLVAMERLSGLLLAVVPLQTKESGEVADALERAFSLFGPPSILHTDNGTEFSLCASLLKAISPSSRVTKGRAYHPQSNGAAEANVKAVKRMVKSLAKLAALRQSPAKQDATKRAALAEYRVILAEVSIGKCENSHKLWLLNALAKGTARPAEVGWAALLNSVVRMWNLTIHPHCRAGKTPIDTATGHASLPYQAKLHSFDPDRGNDHAAPTGHFTEADLVAWPTARTTRRRSST